MNKLWNKIGWIGFWFCLPALSVYLRRGNRPRILVTHGDKVLLVKSWLGDGRWQLPGGGVHKNEDPKTAAIRELLEETGLELDTKDVTKKGEYTQTNDLLQFSYALFTAKVHDETLPEYDTAEITVAQWVSKKDLRPANAQQHVLDSLK